MKLTTTGKSTLILAAALVLVPLLAGGAAATVSANLTPALSPTPIAPAGADTAVLAFSLNSSTFPDTLLACTVTLAGSLTAAEVTQLRLHLDANLNGYFDAGTDTLVGTFTFLSGYDWRADSLTQMLATGADSFVVVINLADTALATDSFQSGLPAAGIWCQNGLTGPLAPLTMAGLWTIDTGAGGSAVGVSLSVPPLTPTAINPTAGDTAVLGLSINAPGADTLTTFTVTFVGPMGIGGFDTVALRIDADRDGGYNPVVDTVVAKTLTFAAMSGDSYAWSGMAIGYGMPTGGDSFLVTVDLRDAVALTDTFQVRLIGDSILLQGAGSGSGLVAQLGTWSVADSGAGAAMDTVVAVLADTITPGVIDPTGADTTIVAFSVYNTQLADTLLEVTVTLAGYAGSPDDSGALWQDLNQSAALEPGIDPVVAYLAFAGAETWTASCSTALFTGTSDSYLVTFDPRAGAEALDTFTVRLMAGSILLQAGGTGPSADLVQPGSWTIADSGAIGGGAALVLGTAIVPAAIDPTGTDTGILGFSLFGATPDTLVRVGFGLTGSLGGLEVDTILLAYDSDRDGHYAADTDAVAGYLDWIGIAGELKTFELLGANLPLAAGSDSFVVAVNLADGVDVSCTLAVSILPDSFQLATAGNCPGAPLVQPGVWTVADSTPWVDTAIVVAALPTSDTGMMTIDPLAGDTAIVGFSVYGGTPDTLLVCSVMVGWGDSTSLNTLVDTAQLFTDGNQSGRYEAGSDTLVAALVFGLIDDSGITYTGFGLAYPLAAGADSFVVTADLKDGAPAGDTFGVRVMVTLANEPLDGSDTIAWPWTVGDSTPGAADSGIVHLEFMDVTFINSPDNFNVGDTAFLELYDTTANTNAGTNDSVLVWVVNLSSNDTETIYLNEVGLDTACFRGAVGLTGSPDSVAGNQSISVTAGQVLELHDVLFTLSDTATIAGGAAAGFVLGTAITPMAIDPAAGETGVIAFSLYGTAPDTLLYASLTIDTGAGGLQLADFDSVQLWFDGNLNGRYDSPADSLIAAFGPCTYTLTPNWIIAEQAAVGYALPAGFDSFVITVDLRDGVGTGQNFAVRVQGLGINLAAAGSCPDTDVAVGGLWSVADSGVAGGGSGPAYLNLMDAGYAISPTSYAVGDTAYLELYDTTANLSAVLIDSPTVRVRNQVTLEVEYVILTETGIDGSCFRGAVGLTGAADSVANNGLLQIAAGQNLEAMNDSMTLFDSAQIAAGPSTVFVAPGTVIVPAAIDPTTGDTGIVAFSLYASASDMLTGCTVTLDGSLQSASVMMITLWQDDRNGQYESGNDTWLATLTIQGYDSDAKYFGSSGLTHQLPTGADSFVVTIDLIDSVGMDETFAVRIGSGNIVCNLAGRGPDTGAAQGGYWTVADSTPANQVGVAVVPTLLGGSIFATAPDTPVLAVSINALTADTLAGCTLTLNGLSSAAVDSVAIWWDMDYDGQLTPMMDQLVGILTYSSGYDWSASGLEYTLWDGSDSFIFTVDLADIATPGDSFSASVGIDGVFLPANGYGPTTPATLAGLWVIAAATPPPVYDTSVLVNFGETQTYTETVTVQLFSDMTAWEMQVSNDSTFAGATWELYVPWKYFYNLGTGDGVKTVYARFRSALGAVSAIAADSIVLDGSPPAGVTLEIWVDTGVCLTGDTTASTSINCLVGVGEDTSNLEFRISEFPDAMGAVWLPFADTDSVIPYELTAYSDTKTIYFFVRDAVWNIAVAMDTVVLQAGVMPARGLMGTASPGGDSIWLIWQPSVSPGIIGYNLYTDFGSGMVNYVDTIASLPMWTMWYETGPLPVPDTWVFAIRAVGPDGTEEQNQTVRTTVQTFSTVSSLSATMVTPVAGQTIGGIMCYVSASVTGDTGTGTAVRFEYRAAGDPEWTSMTPSAGMSNPVWWTPWFTQWDISALPDATYELRALAWNTAETATAPGVISVTKQSAGAEVYVDFNDTGLTQKETVYAGDTVTTTLSDTSGFYEVYIPPAALGTLSGQTAITVQIIADTAAAFGNLARGQFDTGGAVLEVSLDNGTNTFDDTITVTIPYTDNNGDSIIDGTRIRLELVTIYYYSEADGAWHQVERANTGIDAARKVILCYVNHFSKFSSGKEYQGGDLGAGEGDEVPDGTVNSDDLKKMNGHFGAAHGNSNYNSDADIVTTGTSEGRVDEEDLFEFAEQYGQ